MGKRWLVGSLMAGLVLIAGSLLLVTRSDSEPRASNEPSQAVPRDQAPVRAQVGQAYRFVVGHCGLGHVVEFDQSYWDLDRSTVTEEEDGRFGINSDVGTMTLVNPDVAIYVSSRGGNARLTRHVGAKTFSMCA